MAIFSKNIKHFKAKKGEVQINRQEIEKLSKKESILSSRLFYLRRFGDEIEGVLYPPKSNDQFRQKVYPIDRFGDPKDCVSIPGNKHLVKLIKKHELIGKYVRFVYVADKLLNNGHKQKLYVAYVNKGWLTDKWERKTERA